MKRVAPDALLEGGTILRMSFGTEGRLWWIDGRRALSPEEIERLGNRLIEEGDSLFGWRGFSQTWRIAED